jgi:hypothetical protein
MPAAGLKYHFVNWQTAKNDDEFLRYQLPRYNFLAVSKFAVFKIKEHANCQQT